MSATDRTLAQAAAELGLEPATLRQQIASGRLRGRKVGPLWIVSARELERYRTTSLGRPGRRKAG